MPAESRQDKPLFADATLAARIEALAAAEMRRFVSTARTTGINPAADCIGIAGGVATYLGRDSLVNQVVGAGFSGAVSAQDVADIEGFYREHDARGVVSVCPLAHPTLPAALAAQGWVPDAFEHVLVRRLWDDSEFDPTQADIEVREVASDEERDTWAIAAATGFSAPLPPLAPQLELGAVVVRRPGVRLFLAFIEGEVAGTGEVHLEDGVAWLSADATLPRFRARGVQAALQRHRLAVGAREGCELAVTETTPGSGSQRNMERLGFRVAYTRVDVTNGPTYREQTASGRSAEGSGS